MRKIDYDSIKWDARSNWEFCGSKNNLREVWDRYARHFGVRVSVEEFGYRKADRRLAFDKGDIVTYPADDGSRGYAIVDVPVGTDGFLYLKLPNGHHRKVPTADIPRLAAADVPEELVALARAEAGKPVDLSKCPLKAQGACMRTGNE